MGWIERADCLAKEIEFRSNVYEGFDFDVDATEQHHSYAVFWTLKARVNNKKGKAVTMAEVKILDRTGEEVMIRTTDDKGLIMAELPEYTVDGEKISYSSPYTLIVKKKKTEFLLNKNKEIGIIVR